MRPTLLWVLYDQLVCSSWQRHEKGNILSYRWGVCGQKIHVNLRVLPQLVRGGAGQMAPQPVPLRTSLCCFSDRPLHSARAGFDFWFSSLYLFAGTVITSEHKLSALNHRNVLSRFWSLNYKNQGAGRADSFSGDEEVSVPCLSLFLWCPPAFLGLYIVISCAFPWSSLCVCLCVQMSPL